MLLFIRFDRRLRLMEGCQCNPWQPGNPILSKSWTQSMDTQQPLAHSTPQTTSRSMTLQRDRLTQPCRHSAKEYFSEHRIPEKHRKKSSC